MISIEYRYQIQKMQFEKEIGGCSNTHSNS